MAQLVPRPSALAATAAGGGPEGPVASVAVGPRGWAAAAAGGMPAPRLCAVVVDDNEDALQILTTVLRYCGTLVLAASSAAQAERICRVVRPDIIICDLAMPRRTGYELLRRLRARKDLSGVPAIAITAYREEHSLQRARAAGFDEYLEKPLDAFDLYSLIERLTHRGGRPRGGT
jgi:CheY-like chemotaxis protein